MKRREFAKLTGLSAVAVSTTGFIKFNGKLFEGDCVTTTDILGPFYRPNSPIRNNLLIEGTTGDIVELLGIVRHKDCQSPYENAKIEIWHCSADGIYDNDSDEYRYRGTTYCDSDGKYKFITQIPVPYDIGEGLFRPAHFHLMISAAGYQSLITQIYFHGDPYLDKDSSSSALKAENRILNITDVNNVKTIVFDCNMNDRLKASYSSLVKIIGKYRHENNGKIYYKEYFEKDGLLWMKNNVYGKSYEYIGENKFEYGGMSPGLYERLQFDLKNEGIVKLKLTSLWENGIKRKRTYTKI